MDRSAVEQAVRMARVVAAEAVPWLAPALYAARLVLAELPQVSGVDKCFRVYFNPHAVSDWLQRSDKHTVLRWLAFLWVHEVWHIIREHAERVPSMSCVPTVWNLAADLEINDWVPEGLQAPSDFPLSVPQQYGLPIGQLAEYYYAQLVRAMPQDSKAVSGGNRGGGQAEPEDASGDGGSNRQPDQRKGFSGTGKPWRTQDEGSGVHGQARPWEIGESEGSNG